MGFYYFARTFTEFAGGRKLVGATCEKCGQRYFYILTRRGVGSKNAHYGLFPKSAKSKAEALARENLELRLEQEAEPVPCPQCHWINEELIEKYRQQLYGNTANIIVIANIVGLSFAGFLFVMLLAIFGQRSPIPPWTAGAVVVLTFSSAYWIPLVHRAYRRRFNPNATHPAPPTVPMGTPPALVESIDDETGARVIAPAAELFSAGYIAADGDRVAIVFHPDQLELPDVCCVCLGEADTTYRTRLAGKDETLAAPLCNDCSRRLSVRWWRLVLLLSCISFCAAALFAPFAAAPQDHIGRWIIFFTVGLTGAALLIACIPVRKYQPFRLELLDPQRGIVKFSAINPDYTTLLLSALHRSHRIIIDDP